MTSLKMTNPDYLMPSRVTFTGQNEDNDDVASLRTEKKSNRRRTRANSTAPVDGKKSSIRYKFMLEAVRQELLDLQKENELLRIIVRERISPLELAEQILKDAEAPAVDIHLPSSVMMDEENEFVEKEEPSVPVINGGVRRLSMGLAPAVELEKPLPRSPRRLKMKYGKASGGMDQSPPEVPRVLSVPRFKREPSGFGSCSKEEEKIDHTDYHFGGVESLAAALSGDIAF